MKWGDGEIRLAFWDSLHGEDIIYILSERGDAFLELEEGELLEQVNLVEELCKLAARFAEEAEAEIQQVMATSRDPTRCT